MTVIATIAMKCPNMMSHFDLKWFELGLLSYLINLQWDDCYSGNCDEMSKYECFVQLGLNMCHIFHWVVFILITPGLGCNFNFIR